MACSCWPQEGCVLLSVFYQFMEATRLDGLFGVRVSGIIIQDLSNTALFQVRSAMLLLIFVGLRMCSVMYLGPVVPQEGPVHL